jgi:hypothetical protein
LGRFTRRSEKARKSTTKAAGNLLGDIGCVEGMEIFLIECTSHKIRNCKGVNLGNNTFVVQMSYGSVGSVLRPINRKQAVS